MNVRTRALAGAGAVLVLAAGIGIGVTLTGGGSGSKPTAPVAATAATTSLSAATFTLGGTFTLKLGAFQWDRAADGSTPCTGRQGYDDITEGTPVVVTDQGGTAIATGELGTGSAAVDSATGRATQCVFGFEVSSVPDRPFYGITVSHRGTQTYSASQVRTGGVSLTLG